jgi:hypothetical protein
LFAERRELSYSLEPPIALLRANIEGIEILVNGRTEHQLFANRLRVWNSGSIPLKIVPLWCEFGDIDTLFAVFGVRHETTPQHEFGRVEEQAPTRHSLRIVYELLNPGDEDNITIVTNRPHPPSVSSKAEGMKFKRATSQRAGDRLPVLSGLMAAIAALFTMLLEMLSRSARRRRESKP